MPEAIACAAWDELEEGASRALSMGPLTRTDFVRFAGANGDFNPNHHDELYAQGSGFPTPFAPGMIQGGYLGRMLTEWLGPHSLRTFRIRFSAQAWPGDMVHCKGKIVKKYEAGGEKRVEVEAEAVSQNGDVLIKGFAVAAPQG
ncbi:MAG: MaoC/PaaZ C-terminal domain-containing protein [bacterium]|nr:MaoC/PaaZ C-terminal domain-containing protein [bacterium]